MGGREAVSGSAGARGLVRQGGERTPDAVAAASPLGSTESRPPLTDLGSRHRQRPEAHPPQAPVKHHRRESGAARRSLGVLLRQGSTFSRFRASAGPGAVHTGHAGFRRSYNRSSTRRVAAIFCLEMPSRCSTSNRSTCAVSLEHNARPASVSV